MNGRRVWLVGPMAVGKTTVGRLLAARLGCPYVDNDAQLLAATGRGLAWWSTAPIEELHAVEARLLATAAALPPPFVAGVAAAVADRPADVTLLRSSGYVVFLTAPLDELVRRAAGGATRPLGTDVRATLTDQLARRDAVYRHNADLVVDTAADPLPAPVDRIVAALSTSVPTPDPIR